MRRGKRGGPRSNEQEQTMRTPTERERGTEVPAPIGAASHSAKAQAAATGPGVSPPVPAPCPEPDRPAPPRLHVPDRQQLLSSMTIDELLEADHPARSVWSYAEGLDLTFLYDRIHARG